MIKTTTLAVSLALTAPFAVNAETLKTKGYDNYRVSCEATTCGNFDVTFEGEEKVAQTRRTRTRTRTRSSEKEFFKDFYVGGGAGVIFGDGLDVGFQGHVFGGTWYNKFIAAEAEFTFGFASIDDIETPFGDIDIDENITILGFFLNPRFQYEFENSKITAFAAPGIGLVSFDGNTELGFQIKAGAEYPVSNKLDAFAQGRFQSEGDIIAIEGGVVFDLSK